MKDEKTRIEEAVSAMTNLCNIMGHDTKLFVDRMDNEHRTLQQAFTGVCLAWIQHCASDEYRHDGRNEASHAIAKKLLKGFDKYDLALPTI